MNPINKALLGAGAAVVFAIFVAFSWLLLANAHLKTKVAEAEAYGAACHFANDAFSVKVAQQNKAVKQLQANSLAHEKQAQAAAQAAQKTARVYFAAADEWREAKPHGNACATAETFFNIYLEGDK